MPTNDAHLDAQLRHALDLHRARRFAEAEKLYQQVLAFRSDFAEVHVNCAMAQLSQDKRDKAEASLRRAIATKPEFAKAHYHLGDALSFGGRFEEAAAAYQRAVQLKADYVEAHNNLGNALLFLGQLDAAANAYRRTIALKPDFVMAINNLGHIHLRGGRFEEARMAFVSAVSVKPDYAEAHNNLGNALQQLGRPEEAQLAFRTAIRLAPRYADAHVNLASSLFESSKPAEAADAATSAIRLNPSAPEAHNALGNALREQGMLAEAEACYREAIRLKPDYAEGYNHLGMILEEYGRLDEAFAQFSRHAELTYGPEARPDGPLSVDPEPKKRHDQEQQAWLGAAATAFHIAPAPRMPGPAVNPNNRVAEVSEEWRTRKPQIVVIDDLLTPEALGALRQFCLASTIWHKPFDEGYLGALPEYGFAAPLVAQIAEELRGVYPAIIGDHPLLHFWGFKYDSRLRGIKVHADFAAVNVNFWITPDEANLDPEHGGLVVWDAAKRPLDWDFVRYNAADEEIRAYLSRKHARSITIPYRTNRAVIFDSDLFHETDVIRFKPGYENRRINVTLLFGRRQNRA